MKLYIVAGLLALTNIGTAASPAPTFLGDNNTSMSMLESASDFAEMNGSVYFSAMGPFGAELYKTDGSSTWAELVADINIGDGGGANNAPRLTSFKGNLYFFANDGIHGSEVWKSDGTSSGTRMLVDINPGSGSSNPNSSSAGSMRFVAGKDYLFFVAGTSSPRKLYRTDGTSTGTVPLGITSIPDGNDIFCTAGELTYFLASTPAAGLELWRTDGTDAGTFMVKDINSGTGSGSIDDMVAHNGELYFTAYSLGSGTRLYKTNGTSAGTVMLSSVSVSSARSTVISADKVFFVNGSKLYTNNGTAGNSVLVKEVESYLGSSLTNIAPVSEGVVFTVREPEGYALYKSDGTAAGTVKLTSLTTMDPDGSIVSTGMHAFLIRHYGATWEFWCTDGTESGTSPVTGFTFENVGFLPAFNVIGNDVYCAGYSGSPHTAAFRISAGSNVAIPIYAQGQGAMASFQATDLTKLDDKVVFTGWNSESGREPWVTNGTLQGTHILADLVPGPGSSNPSRFASLGSKTVFTVNIDGNDYGLAISDGTSSGTILLFDKEWFYVGLNTVSTGDAAYLVASENPRTVQSFNTVWRTDGTLSGTVKLDQPQGLTIFPRLVSAGKTVLFTASTTVSSSGNEVWKADETSIGISILKDIRPGSGSAVPTTLVGLNFNGSFYFSATDSDHGTELWRTDGTEAGTQMVVDAVPGFGGSNASVYGVRDGKLYFLAMGGNSRDLWETDGTSTGAKKLLNGHISGFTMGFAKLGNKLVFSNRDITGMNLEPWVYNYETGTTSLLKDIFPGPASSGSRSLVTVGSYGYFLADDGVEGEELWVTDGTSEGTRFAHIIRPGIDGATIRNMRTIGNKLVFSANDGIHGQELWIADPAAGTVNMVLEAEPGAGSSTPFNFTKLDGQMIYSAYSSETGMDLWSLQVEDQAAVDDWAIY